MSALVDQPAVSGDGASGAEAANEGAVDVGAVDVGAADVWAADGDALPPGDAPARPTVSPAQLRVDFGAHLEANYQRLVAQLYAITLDPGEAHDVVQDAYSRAWRDWAAIGRSPDPSAWIRRVAVRSTIRSWRRVLARVGIGRPAPIGEGADPRTAALLSALGRLPAAERRAVVLFHMAGASLAEIAAVEQDSQGVVQARLARARHVVVEGMADVLPEVLGLLDDDGRFDDGHLDDYGPDDYGPDDGGRDDLGDVDGGRTFATHDTGYDTGYTGDPYGSRGHDDEGEHR